MFLISRTQISPDAFPVLHFCACDMMDFHSRSISDVDHWLVRNRTRILVFLNIHLKWKVFDKGSLVVTQSGRGSFIAQSQSWNNSSILACVSGGRQQHSTAPPICIPARPGLGLGFHSHLEL